MKVSSRSALIQNQRLADNNNRLNISVVYHVSHQCFSVLLHGLPEAG